VCEEERRWKEGEQMTEQLKKVRNELTVVVDMIVSACNAINDEKQVDIREDIRALVTAHGTVTIRQLFEKYLP